MAETQKLYLGDDEIGITRFGEDGNLIRGAFPFSLGIDYLVVGAGGGGGSRNGQESGGGGAGRFLSQTATLATANTLSIVIGTAGAVDTNGGQTTLIGSGITQRMPGGGAGGQFNVSSGDGNSGGSGGGGAAQLDAQGGTNAGAGIGISDDQGTGVDGSNGSSSAAGNGGGSSTQWLDGITYAIGGARGNNGGTPETTKGSGGDGGNDTGTISPTAGQGGIVKIRYAGNQKATGGTITQDGGYTYHTFTSNGTFTVTG